MKKGCGFICFVLCAAFVTMCGFGCSKKPASVATEKPTMIISTVAPTGDPVSSTEAPSPTPKRSTEDYIDLVEGNEYTYFTASTVEDAHTQTEKYVSYCFDNNPETRWSSQQNDVEESWICVSFGYPVIFGGLTVKENKTWGTVGTWDAQYYDEEKQDWVTCYEGYAFEDEEYYLTDFETPATYQIRILFYECTALAVTLNEVDLYGTKVSVAEGTEPRTFSEEEKKIDREKINLSAEYSASTTENEGNDAALHPFYTFDGKEDTRWSSAFYDLDDGECWLKADFGQEISLSGVVVKEVTSWGHVTSYSIQVQDGDGWKTVYSGEEFIWGELIDFGGIVKGSCFRFVFYEGTSSVGTVTIAEIEFYS